MPLFVSDCRAPEERRRAVPRWRWLSVLAVGCGHGLVFAWLLRDRPLPAPADLPVPLRVSWIEAPAVRAAEPPPEPAPPLPRSQPRPAARPLPAVPPVVATPAVPQVEPAPERQVAMTPVQPVAAPAVAAATTAPVVPPPVTPPLFAADYLNNPAPAYPRLSRELGEEGRVLLRVLVSSDGQAESVRLETGSGHERLDQAALGAVRQWRFVPARQGGTAVAAWVLVPIAFNLRRQP